jgi:hypothetical protein
MVGVEQSLRWSDGYVIFYSGAVCRSYLDCRVQEFPSFQLVLSAEVGVKIHKGGNVGPWTGVLVVKGLLKEGASEDLEFVLKCGVKGKGGE